MGEREEDNRIVSEVLQACQGKSKIYCYGAGHFGSVVHSFLEINKISVKSYIVSRYDGEDTEKVSLWENISVDDLRDSLVILSLSEKHHESVRPSCLNLCLWKLIIWALLNIFAGEFR